MNVLPRRVAGLRSIVMVPGATVKIYLFGLVRAENFVRL